MNMIRRFRKKKKKKQTNKQTKHDYISVSENGRQKMKRLMIWANLSMHSYLLVRHCTFEIKKMQMNNSDTHFS